MITQIRLEHDVNIQFPDKDDGNQVRMTARVRLRCWDALGQVDSRPSSWPGGSERASGGRARGCGERLEHRGAALCSSGSGLGPPLSVCAGWARSPWALALRELGTFLRTHLVVTGRQAAALAGGFAHLYTQVRASRGHPPLPVTPLPVVLSAPIGAPFQHSTAQHGSLSLSLRLLQWHTARRPEMVR